MVGAGGGLNFFLRKTGRLRFTGTYLSPTTEVLLLASGFWSRSVAASLSSTMQLQVVLSSILVDCYLMRIVEDLE